LMLTFNDVKKSFGEHEVLKGVDFTVENGETLVIVGPSGTGKSVTLKHMVGLLRPSSGEILFEGKSILDLRGNDLVNHRKNFGMLFQSGALLAWLTVEQNIALPLVEQRKLPLKEIEKKVKKSMELLGLEGAENKRPAEISGGMKKRVGLARAIVMEPKVVLYDEPTSGLDPVMSRHIDKLILDMQEELGITSIVVTHDLHSAFSIGDRVAMLNQGKIIEIGAPKEFVKSKEPFVQEFIKAQFSAGYIEGIEL
ncbi:MAG: ABC transporter ATP-binding protein, partial [Lentisphaeraceae bacterium]|nr:ABC transporter ATP-binding protein [Lentisphaeraceae bacterium]